MKNRDSATFHSERWGDPPYVPFGTFRNFLGKITIRPPSRIDDSVMPLTFCVMRLQLSAALRYLNLVPPEGFPTDRLRLIGSQGAERKAVLRDTLKQAYAFLFAGFPLGDLHQRRIRAGVQEARGIGGHPAETCGVFRWRLQGGRRRTSAYIKPFRGISGLSSGSCPRHD